MIYCGYCLATARTGSIFAAGKAAISQIAGPWKISSEVDGFFGGIN
jgi:hypothetical protein